MIELNKMTQDLLDKSFRQSVCDDPKSYAQKIGYKVSDDTNVVVVKNTKDIFYITIANTKIVNKEDLESLSAARVGTSTAGTAGTIGTLGTALGSSISTVGSAGTIGSTGTVK